MPETPEQKARREIDADLAAAGWVVQDRDETDITAGRGVAVREFPMKSGFGFADYLLYLDRKAAGAVTPAWRRNRPNTTLHARLVQQLGKQTWPITGATFALIYKQHRRARMRSKPFSSLIPSSPSRLSTIQPFWPLMSGAGWIMPMRRSSSNVSVTCAST
jgi:hypothetical protein